LKYTDATATQKIEAIAAYLGLAPEDGLTAQDYRKRRSGTWTETDSQRVLPQFEEMMNEDAPPDWRSLFIRE
jgi:hypothetical protein